MKYNLRNLLWHMKYKGQTDEELRIAECKEQIYDAIKDNVEYFSDQPIFECYGRISMSNLRHMSLDDFIELQNSFNKSMTGLLGFKYDNCTHICISDIFGHCFNAACYKQKNAYDFFVWDMSGQHLLCKIITESKYLTREQIKEIEKCHDTLMEYYEKLKELKNRYNQIAQYSNYIDIGPKKYGYANYTCQVSIRKDIPIDLTEHEIAKYTDGWNYCFGGSISKVNETDNAIVYNVKVYTD